MWSMVLIPIMTMAIGFLTGVVTMDAYSDDRRVSKLEREVKRLKKRMEEAE